MRPATRLLPLLLLLALGVGARCTNPSFRILAPADGDVVTRFEFEVRVALDPALYDPASLELTLNGEPLALVRTGDEWWAKVGPGPPLRDHNQIRARARRQRNPHISVLLDCTFDYLPPKARARRITDPGDLITGPLGHSQVGDYLLENDVARYAIQRPGVRDLHSIGQFGGNLIDAELVGRPGRDQFFELQPSVNIETVIHATEVEIVNDGQDGTAAIIRTCGPDDLLDYVNPSSQVERLGVMLPPGVDDRDYDVEGCTEYRLEPERRELEIETTVFNNTGEELAFYVGDYVNGMGTLEQFADPGIGAFGLGETLVTPRTEMLSFAGFRSAEGVDYALVPISLPGEGPSSSFTTSGVSFLLHSHSVAFTLFLGLPPVFRVPPFGEASFLRYFAVGDGSFANGRELVARLRGEATGELRGCVTVGGRPAASARVVAGPVQAGRLARVAAHFLAGPDGCYRGRIPEGDYGVAAALEGAPYEGGGPEPMLHPAAVRANAPAVVDIALPDSGRVRVAVEDPSGRPIPARVMLVGFDPSPEIRFDELLLVLEVTTTAFTDQSRDPLPYGVARVEYAGADGVAEFDMEPGDYELVVSRGTEWSAFRMPLRVEPGGVHDVEARIAQVLDTPGFVSSDFHVHFLNSPDSRIAFADRAMQFAGEGVDNIVATEHDAHSDLAPTIEGLGLETFVHSTIGEEITTFDTGHFNAYPRGLDPSRPSGGSTDWAGAAPPGRDFPAYGHYNLSPAEIEAAATSDPFNPPGDVVVQVNHIGSHFSPLRIDTSLVPPASMLSPEEALAHRLDPSVGNFFHPFPALELWNGMDRGHQSEFLDERIGIWMNLLNQGIHATAVADTDTHGFLNLRAAGARSWTASSTDDPAEIDEDEIARSVRAGRLVGGQGLYVQTRLLATDGPGVADLGLGGSTLITATSGEVDLEISVQAPAWSAYDTIEIYANAPTRTTGTSGGTPVAFTADPLRVLTRHDSLNEGDHFTVVELPVAPGVPGASRRETRRVVRLSGLTRDTWVVVVVRGTDGVSPPLHPVMPFDLDPGTNTTLADLLDGNLGEGGVLALGFTNPLYVDVDGNGRFDPPWLP